MSALTNTNNLVADSLSSLAPFGNVLHVSISNQIVHLLSDQLYQSPLKAVEELVVNSYDAEATECRVFVPFPSDTVNQFVVVYDNGIGMSYAGLVDLWHIASSTKRELENQKKRKRKQIGKFGIGKLAARTLAHRLTYITKGADGILTVTIDFRNFSDEPTGAAKHVETQVHVIPDWDQFIVTSMLQGILATANIEENLLNSVDNPSWTLALLEDFTDKAKKIKHETLKWVLETAMPLQADFKLYLNGADVKSSKESLDHIVDFDLSDFSAKRLDALSQATGETWTVEGKTLKSRLFPSGITGSIFLTRATLSGGKSDDLIRSHGFFIRVRNRLVNDGDALFGLKPLEHGTFARFRADIQADDLDIGLKASRESVEESTVKEQFRTFLREIFREADSRYAQWQKDQEKPKPRVREGERNEVPPRLVEYPVADALTTKDSIEGAEADRTWFYVKLDPNENLSELIKDLYTSKRNPYKYILVGQGITNRLVEFDPKSATFWINQDHELAEEYVKDSNSRRLLEDIVTAEAMLEVYLRQSQVPLNAISRVLEQRDELLRSLVRDRSYSFDLIATRLRDAATTDDNQLEIMQVVAARALGFVATHMGGASNPDGIAKLGDNVNGQKVITLEAKSSADASPSLAALDFSGLREHVIAPGVNADGCLLIAPSYPGSSKAKDSAVSKRAIDLKISCWTIEQFANFVAIAEQRQLNARHVLDIVLNYFAPEDVTEALKRLLAEPTWHESNLYSAIVKTFQKLEGRLKNTPLTVEGITMMLVDEDEFVNIESSRVEEAVRDLQGASQGGMVLRGRTVVLQVSTDELDRRLSHLTRNSSQSRRRSSFRQNDCI